MWCDTDLVWWNSTIAGIILMTVLFGLSLFKKIGIIVRLASIGVVSILFLYGFIIFESLELIELPNFPAADTPIVYSDIGGWPNLAGVMFLSYCIHNAIIPITNSQKDMSMTQPNIAIGTLCYIALVYLERSHASIATHLTAFYNN